MNSDSFQQKVISYLQDAHAMEQNVLRMLDSMITTTKDTEIRSRLQQHRMESEKHEQLLRARLQQLGSSVSWTADVSAMAGALLKGVADQMRGDKAGKNARDAYITEHTEIAAYELLGRLAQRAGDNETARIAHLILEDEYKMAEWIAARWNKFIDLTLDEYGMKDEPTYVGPRNANV